MSLLQVTISCQPMGSLKQKERNVTDEIQGDFLNL